MAVTKTITYVGPSGTLYSATVSIDLQKLAVGTNSDEERVYLTVSAPGISSSGYWRKNIDEIVEDAIFASASGNETRYTHLSGEYSAYGDKIVNTASGYVNGVSGIIGIRQQLINLATI